jgi:hypothetical protein
MMKAFVTAVIAILAFPVANARADEWTVGPGVAYVSNINHVLDIYKADVKAQIDRLVAENAALQTEARGLGKK